MMTVKSKYHPFIDGYMHDVATGKVKVSKHVHMLMDWLHTKLDDAVIDAEQIERSVGKIERYFPYELLPLQKFIIALIVGVRDNSGLLLFSDVFIKMGRGSGKNGLISAIAFDAISNTQYRKYNVDIVATSEEQAKTSFQDVYEVIDESERLKKAFYRTKEIITFRKSRSQLRYRTSNSKTADGGRPGMVIFDEVHAYEDYENIKVNTSGLGKVPDARVVYITTDGNVRGGVLDELTEEAVEVLSGNRPNSRMLPIICCIDNEEEASDPEAWEKAVPLVNHWPPLKQEMVKAWDKAQSSPQLLIEFMTKRMNFPIQSTTTAVAEWDDILATNQPVPDLDGSQCIGGVDYAEVNDFAACGVLFKHDGKRVWRHHSFVCKKGLHRKPVQLQERVHEAEQLGLCTIVDDVTIRSAYIADWFVEQASDYAIIDIACDSFRERLLREAFDERGLPLSVVRSGPITHNKIAPLIDEMFATKSIIYGDDMLMRWYTNNVKVTLDGKGNKTYGKIDPEKRKTDGFMALIHAMSFDDKIEEYGDLEAYEAYIF